MRVEYNTKTPKTKEKKTNTLRYNNLFLLKRFKRILIGDSCRLLLEAGHLDDSWFATTQP